MVFQTRYYSVFVPAIIGYYRYYMLEKKTRLIVLLVLFACIPHFARAYSKIYSKEIPYLIYNLYMILEFFLLLMFFRNKYHTITRNRIFNILWIICFLIGLISIAMYGIYDKFLSEWLCFNNLIYTTWILLLIYDLYERDEDISSLKTPTLLYLLGLFLYTSCTMLVFPFSERIRSSTNSYLKSLWIIHGVFNAFMYMAFSIGFIIENRAGYQNKFKNSSTNV